MAQLNIIPGGSLLELESSHTSQQCLTPGLPGNADAAVIGTSERHWQHNMEIKSTG